MEQGLTGAHRRKRLLVGNWKMHGSLQANASLLAELKQGAAHTEAHCDVVVCAPFLYVPQLRQLLEGSSIAVGAQDVSAHDQGAYTGEVSAHMLSDLDCRWVIVGHSERRQYHAETDQLIAEKIRRALEAGLRPILCVGETAQDREAGTTYEVIRQQLALLLQWSQDDLSRLSVAYEPVWAIGSGQSATPEQAQDVHAFIRAQWPSGLAAGLHILYGGSVKSQNAAQLFAMPDIDGALVGGASLDAREFLQIAAA